MTCGVLGRENPDADRRHGEVIPEELEPVEVPREYLMIDSIEKSGPN